MKTLKEALLRESSESFWELNPNYCPMSVERSEDTRFVVVHPYDGGDDNADIICYSDESDLCSELAGVYNLDPVAELRKMIPRRKGEATMNNTEMGKLFILCIR